MADWLGQTPGISICNKRVTKAGAFMVVVSLCGTYGESGSHVVCSRHAGVGMHEDRWYLVVLSISLAILLRMRSSNRAP